MAGLFGGGAGAGGAGAAAASSPWTSYMTQYMMGQMMSGGQNQSPFMANTIGSQYPPSMFYQPQPMQNMYQMDSYGMNQQYY